MRDWNREIARRLAPLRLSPAREAEITEELAQHLEDRYRELVAGGTAEDEACRIAVEELKDEDLLATGLRRVEQEVPQEPIVLGSSSGHNLLASLWQDIRYGLRQMRRNPGFTTVAVLTLALGIGANTGVFTIVNTFLLSPLPVEKPNELIAINAQPTKTEARSGEINPISFLNLKDLQAGNLVFGSLAGYTSPMALTVATKSLSERVFAELVTGNYFQTLGLRPFMGRFFLPHEDSTPGADPVVVIGYAAWQSRFGGTPNILGQTMTLNGTTFTVIGVAPKGFIGLNAIFGPDMWVPAMMAKQVLPAKEQNALSDRGISLFTGVGRMKAGVSLAKAEANLKTIAAALAKEYPDADEGQSVVARPLAQAVTSGGQGQQLEVSSVLLMAIVGLVLLVACSNVANLLLARADSRRQEVAVRLAMGAGRRRLVRQLLTESVLLALLSGVFGFAFGYAGCKLLWSFRPAEFAQNLVEPRLGGGVFIFALAVAVLTGLIFGIVPALRFSRTPLVETLKQGTRSGVRRLRLANVLLIGQVALSLVALVTAALFLRSIRRAYTIDPGFQTRHLALFMLYPSQAGYDRTRAEEFYKTVRDRVAAVPGVISDTWASNMPLWGRKSSGIEIEGQAQRKKSEAISSVVDTVDLDYFSTLGIPILAGRSFTPDDRAGSNPVAIINETMAREYWPNQDPLGKRLQLGAEKEFLQIVGVAKTADYQTLGEAPQACIYLPLRQNFTGDMILYIRTEGDPIAALPAVRGEIRSIDPTLPIDDVRTGAKVIDQAMWGAKIGVGLLGAFGLLALGLAAVGLYGVIAYAVNQRRREIGIRMALGARRATVLVMVMRQGLTVVGVGVFIGLGLSLLAGQAMSRMLYGVSATDPLSLAGASLVLFLVAALACYLPAFSASRVDPMEALRYE